LLFLEGDVAISGILVENQDKKNVIKCFVLRVYHKFGNIYSTCIKKENRNQKKFANISRNYHGSIFVHF
jgi:hypothetical protein